MDHVVLSLHPYPADFLDDAPLKERRLSELSANIDLLTKQLATIDQRIWGRDPCPVALLKDSAFMDAEQKRKVLTQWERFVKGGFSFRLFTDNLYQHLILHCGFIAHYNCSGFYATYWCDDLITLARQSGMTLRPAPGVFAHWQRFLGTFQCWHEWEEMGNGRARGPEPLFRPRLQSPRKRNHGPEEERLRLHAEEHRRHDAG